MIKVFKRLIVVVVAFSFVVLSQTIKSIDAGFKLEITEENIQDFEGVEHRQIKATLHFEGEVTSQGINVLTFNPLLDKDLHLVAADDYRDHSYAGANLIAQAFNVNKKYINQAKVVAGVNGDFYDTTHFFPVMAHIRDYEVIYDGQEGRSLVGFKENGEVVMGTPEFAGYQVFIFDEDGSKKDVIIKIDGFNREPENENEVIAYFHNYKDNDEPILINNDYPKMVFAASNTKLVGTTHFFAKGSKEEIVNTPTIVEDYKFVLTGKELFRDGLIKDTDVVVIQNTFAAPFNDVAHAIGGNQKILIDGAIQQGFSGGADRVRRPRTAIGLKEDGTVILVTVDGDQALINLDGIYVDELSYIMKYFGAYNSINLDGGGSTSMIGYFKETNSYKAINDFSLSSLRSNANGLLIVKGQFHQKLPVSPFPDNREVLETPQNVYITDEGMLYFEAVEKATYYKVLINDTIEHIITGTPYQLELDQRIYSIKIKAFGDFENYKQSAYTNTISYYQNTNGMNKLIEGLLEYASQANRKN